MIYVVSGLPRSGTSMMMRMLDRGGMTVVVGADAQPPDHHNPNGFYESRDHTTLSGPGVRRPERLDELEGKAVKVLIRGLVRWPDDRPAKVILMRRNVEEMVASRRKMAAERLDEHNPNRHPDTRFRPLEDQAVRAQTFLDDVVATLHARPNLDILEVSYNAIARASERVATLEAVVAHLDVTLDVTRMAARMVAVWDDDLYRNRAET